MGSAWGRHGVGEAGERAALAPLLRPQDVIETCDWAPLAGGHGAWGLTEPGSTAAHGAWGIPRPQSAAVARTTVSRRDEPCPRLRQSRRSAGGACCRWSPTAATARVWPDGAFLRWIQERG